VLLGRSKDMIVRGRFNIYPELYESTIERIDGVKRCAIVGIYDEAAADECVVLVVEPRDGVGKPGLEQRLWNELQSGPCCVDSAALPDHILVMTLPMVGRSAKVDKKSLRDCARRKIPCASH
jgi:acyl-CoA synthetase (AMP-forming)/AMP-acid ligase II